MKALSVKTIDVQLTIQKGTAFEVTYHNCEKNEFTVKDTDGVIEIIQNTKTDYKHWLKWFTQSPHITLKLENAYEKIIVDADSNQVKVEDIESEDLDIAVGNGKILIRNVHAKTANVECSNGGAEVFNLKVTDACKIHTTNGKTIVSNSISNEAGYSASCTNGKLQIFEKTYDCPQEQKREGNPMYFVSCANGKCIVT
ncbi:DUF4097 family beta strand repeat-containing protein [Treponema phagedenis]|uniref:DUF4097 domain-containing protein n=1 Tax=Treponema phagedenis TaxID=162 RepID=A0AAE6IUY7_TREPH|nr:DUF4097 family beta strand repeat-containing protein [Treponema phagedenis]NVP24708.1 DUF4097 family beta strand repeat protein [Treponema phagedenis]QEJ98825.1 DUF4097 domain-containing protein [Treponema phagedenis]QEK04330.1 DUF4097 domain-containing protein [Treponema phagedenis]QEK09984.1 DUF4097 domain-containing protein [Treponema phagedenis]QLC58900.1 DUF4097 family beta strand repeat protein [Treponema phagedenis]